MTRGSTMDPRQPVVFTGPSLSPRQAEQLLPRATVLPPVARDDLYQVRERGARVILMLDGVFSHQLAVSPREVIDVASDGALIVGASSMGAVRAAECWPAGVRGVGLVERSFRLGVLDSDDEVAVATNPDRDFAAVSVALVNIRVALSRAVRRGVVERGLAAQVAEIAARTYFPERSWAALQARCGDLPGFGTLRAFCEPVDVKHRDALDAVAYLAQLLRSRPGLADEHGRASDDPFERLDRYPGHDRQLGRDLDELQVELLRWLIGTGRYQRYIWALVAGEPELQAPAPDDPHERAEELRERLAAILARVCADPGSFAARLYGELEFLDELDAELLRWHAISECAANARTRGMHPSESTRIRAREEIAIAQGVRTWVALQEEEDADGLVFGAIPFAWILEASDMLAYARMDADGLTPEGS